MIFLGAVILIVHTKTHKHAEKGTFGNYNNNENCSSVEPPPPLSSMLIVITTIMDHTKGSS